MPDVKRKNLLMAVCTVLATVALAATLGGCAPSQPSGDAGNGGADAASYPVGLPDIFPFIQGIEKFFPGIPLFAICMIG